ncbi:MAG: type IV toxin-antitoxin system AbiEi family antitoxin [Propionibacteriaceae bacterium]|nr:type IV toxin-antitoxin system AbiEi family antitoxin [Propionibacteriaceae bacterium]
MPSSPSAPTFINGNALIGCALIAIGTTVIVVPEPHRPVILDTGGRVVFTVRRPGLVEAIPVQTTLGMMSVTTIEQTLIDLIRRPDLGGLPEEAAAAARALHPRPHREAGTAGRQAARGGCHAHPGLAGTGRTPTIAENPRRTRVREPPDQRSTGRSSGFACRLTRFCAQHRLGMILRMSCSWLFEMANTWC